jgi:hypothetical protein
VKGDSAHPTEIRLRAAVPAFPVLVFGGHETVPEDGAEEG